MAIGDKLVNLEDLKTVRDSLVTNEIGDLKSAFDRYSEWLSIDDNVEQGALTSTGAVTTSSYNAWVRSPDYVPIEKFIEFYKPSGIAADFFIYDSSKALLEKVTPSANTSITLSYAYTIGKQATAKYIKIRAQRNGESTTTPAQFVASGSHVKIAVPETELLEKIDDNAEDISSLEGQMTTEVPITLGITHYIIADNGTATGNPQYDCTDYIPVKKGMKVVISSAIGSGYHALLVYDATKNVIDTYLTNTDVANAEYNITSDSAKFIRAQSRNNTWGTITNSLSVKVYKNTFDYYKSEIEEVKASKPIAVERVNSAKFTISVKSRNGSVVRYDFEKYSKTWESLTYEDGNGNEQTASNVVSANYWNNLYVYNNLTSEYIAQGNSNFIVQVYGDSYHVGDGHGNEVLASFVLICDGKEVDVSSMSNNQIIECEKLLLIEKSYMYKLGGGTADSYANTYPALDTSGNPIVNFIHNMEMSFDVNGVDVNNSLLVKQDGISFQQCHGAMLECYYANFDILSCNNAEESVNTIASDGTATVNTGSTVNLKTYPAQIADYVEMYGKNFYISQKMEQVNPARYGKSNVRFVFYDNRVKAYFQPVFAEFGLPSGETRETFNTGDVIRVTDHRRIDLQGI